MSVGCISKILLVCSLIVLPWSLNWLELKDQKDQISSSSASTYAKEGSRSFEFLPKGKTILSRWDNDRLPIKVFVHCDASEQKMSKRYKQITWDAFQTWTDAAQGRLSFVEVPRKESADLIVTWTAKPQQVTIDGAQKQGVAEVGYGEERPDLFGNREIVSCAIKILTICPHHKDRLGIKQLKAICLHEVGHAIGLEHTSDDHDIMSQSYECHQLSSGDLRQLLTLYRRYPKAYDHSLTLSKSP